MSMIKNSLLVAAGAAATLAGTQVAASADTTVTVKSGDTVYALADANGTTVDAVVAANNLENPSLIFVGQNLTMPGTSAESAAPQEDAAATDQTQTDTYTVVAGDSFWGIANAHGMAMAELLEMNNADVNTVIHPGDELKISGTADAVADNGYTNDNDAAVSAPAAPAADANNVTVDSTNTYPVGQCTWYVKDAVSWVGNWWGNAVDWKYSALKNGRTVDTTPAVGSVVYFAPGVQGADATYGHVAVVDAVNANGTITISEANYMGLMYHTRTISTSGLQFIH
jgi:surface antigen